MQAKKQKTGKLGVGEDSLGNSPVSPDAEASVAGSPEQNATTLTTAAKPPVKTPTSPSSTS